MLILLALCADALIGNYQEKAMKKFDAGNTEVVCASSTLVSAGGRRFLVSVIFRISVNADSPSNLPPLPLPC